MNTRHYLFALLLAATTVVVSVWIASSTAPTVATPDPATTGVDHARIEELERRLAAIEARLGELRYAGPSSARKTETAKPRFEELEQRLAALENARSGTARNAAPTREETRREQLLRDQRRERERVERLAEIVSSKRILADPGATVDAKLAAHRNLRRVADAYTPQMIRDLVRIAQTDPREEVRASTWTFFDGSTTSPLLVEPLLHAMRFDRSDGVRAEAAETLGNYTDNPAVRQALERAAQHDRSKIVREKARRSAPRR